MTNGSVTDYYQLEVGFEFPPSSCRLDSAMVDTYIRAVEENSPLYRDTSIMPPTALAACAMSALSKSVSFPPGSIHVSQELEFLDTVYREDTITCRSKVSRKRERGKLHLMTMDIEVYKNEQKVMAGKVGFVLPQQGN
ncbi:MAG: MaoC family dehydratase [Dehalococcoidia bacterium]|nr:MaoC family dehydratase [Dehalococcoidia bacterium]